MLMSKHKQPLPILVKYFPNIQQRVLNFPLAIFLLFTCAEGE
jgi:hypothetical protein